MSRSVPVYTHMPILNARILTVLKTVHQSGILDMKASSRIQLIINKKAFNPMTRTTVAEGLPLPAVQDSRPVHSGDLDTAPRRCR
jgi:hypothetical protein